MTSLPSIERLTREQLAALKSKIEMKQARQATSLDNLHNLLAQAQANMSAIAAAAEAAGVVLPAATQPQPAPTPNGGKHASPTIKRAKRRRRAKARQVTPQVEAKPVTTPHPTKGIKIGIKYQNPQHPAQQWSGRGKMPGWMQKTGLPKEHFLVK